MPNIIEQQDLLKGLPDDRLSMLMQNPTGDIPPFLVAAEAQRRQSIREQFSGGPQESVVDTLTKQLANVPQNIQPPMQTPPQMPPPQMQAGVGALEQGMRDGGMVQRYQDGSLVERYYRYGPRGAGAPITSVGDASLMSGIYNFMLPRQDQIAPGPRVLSGATVEDISSRAKDIAAQERIQREINESMIPMAESVRDIQAQQRYAQMLGRGAYKPETPPETGDKESAIPRDPNASKQDSSITNKTAVSEDEYRKELEKILGVKAEDSEYIQTKLKELYAGEGASDWEKAQKWFEMAAAFASPGQSLMQSLTRGATIFSEGAAEEQALERQNRQALQEALIKQEIADRIAATQSERDIAKGMLEFKVDEAERARAAQSSAYEREIEGYKWQAQQELETARMYKSAADDLSDALNRRVSDLLRNGALQEEVSKDTEIIDLTKRIEENNLRANNAVIRSRRLQKMFGGATGSLARTEYADGDTMGYLD